MSDYQFGRTRVIPFPITAFGPVGDSLQLHTQASDLWFITRITARYAQDYAAVRRWAEGSDARYRSLGGATLLVKVSDRTEYTVPLQTLFDFTWLAGQSRRVVEQAAEAVPSDASSTAQLIQEVLRGDLSLLCPAIVVAQRQSLSVHIEGLGSAYHGLTTAVIDITVVEGSTDATAYDGTARRAIEAARQTPRWQWPPVSADRAQCSACGLRTMELRGAERLADAVEAAVRCGDIDARSPMADALLDYKPPGLE